MVNGPERIYVERDGRIERVPLALEDEAAVRHLIDRVVAPLGLHIDDGRPWVDARLPDGSRVHAIIPPLAVQGATLTIRRFARVPMSAEDLLRRGSLDGRALELLRSSVESRRTLLVSGGAGAGKTTLLGVLSGFIPNGERIITIEDAAELRLAQEHVVALETRPPNIEGRGEVTVRDLVRNALRMRPDRIVVGEVRGGEAPRQEGNQRCVAVPSRRDWGIIRLRSASRRVGSLSGLARRSIPLAGRTFRAASFGSSNEVQ